MDKQKEALISVANDTEVEGCLRTDYSGRWMFGRTCWAIESAHPTQIIEAAAARGVKGAKTDEMGLNYIVYWPHITD